MLFLMFRIYVLYMFVCLYVDLVSFITVLIDLYVCPCIFLHFLHFFIASLLERKPRYMFSLLIFAAINLIFLISLWYHPIHILFLIFGIFVIYSLSYFGSFCSSLIPK